MEAEAGSGSNDEKNNVIRKPRSVNTVRRPRSNPYILFAVPQGPSTDSNVSERQKSLKNVYHLTNPSNLSRGVDRAGDDMLGNKNGKDDCRHQRTGDFHKRGSRQATKGVLSPAKGKSQCDEKVTLKIKVASQTARSNEKSNTVSVESSFKSPHSSNGFHLRRRLDSQYSSDAVPLCDQLHDIKSSSCKDANERVPTPKNCSEGKIFKHNGSAKKMDHSVEPLHKSKRVVKKRVLPEAFDEDEGDHYLVKGTKISRRNANDERDDKKQNISEITLGNRGDGEGCDFPSKATPGKKLGKKLSLKRSARDPDHTENEDNVENLDSDDVLRKKRTIPNERNERSLTARQRALQSGRDASADPGSSVLEFPNGLPLPPPKDQNLSEVERKLKKTEAAEQRKIRSEKAAREIEAGIIKRLLGQDSNQNKKASRVQKRREELAKMKAANATQLAATTVRWVIAPTGTVVSFPEGMDLPSIFDSKPCRYPPPREKCAGPSCANPYKYRDSKTNLPLCSLECYRSVNNISKPDIISS